MIIDTHAHLDFPDFNEDIEAVLERAAKAGVSRILTVGTSLESSAAAIRLAERNPQVFAIVGVHPTSDPEEVTDPTVKLRELAAHPKVVAIGETGLDYHRLPSSRLRLRDSIQIPALANESPDEFKNSIEDGAYKNAQIILFRQQLELAADLGLNVVIHERDAWNDTLEVLRDYSDRLQAVFHCFGGDPGRAAEVLEMGHLVSFTGIVTFKNAALVKETAAWLPEGTFMVETDCPYLAPVPHRGKRCEPAFTAITAAAIAELRDQPLEALAEQTTRTAESFFDFNR